MAIRLQLLATARELERQERKLRGLFGEFDAANIDDVTELQRNLGSAAAYARLVVEGMADEALLRRRKPAAAVSTTGSPRP